MSIHGSVVRPKQFSAAALVVTAALPLSGAPSTFAGVALDASQIRWSDQLDFSDEDAASALAVTPDGGYVLGVSSRSSGFFGVSNTGRLRSYDSRGVVGWTQVVGGNEGLVSALTVDADGNVFGAGSVRSSTGVFDSLVFRTNAAGERIFTTTFAETDFSTANSLAFRADGELFVGGNEFYPDGQNRSAAGGYVRVIDRETGVRGGGIARLNSLGEPGGFAASTSLRTITPFGDGLLGGGSTTGRFVTDATADPTSSDAFVFALGGSLGVSMQFGVPDVSDAAVEISETADGGFVVGGATGGATTGRDVFVRGFDSAGEALWDWTGLSDGSDDFSALTVDTAGNTWVAGRTRESFGDDFDLYIVKLDAEGNLVFETRFGSSGDDSITDFEVVGDDEVVVAGTFTVADGFFRDFDAVTDQSDAFIVSVSIPEPTSLSAVVALGGFGLRRRRRS